MVEKGGSEEGFWSLWLERYARMAEREPASQVLYISSPKSTFIWCSYMMVFATVGLWLSGSIMRP